MMMYDDDNLSPNANRRLALHSLRLYELAPETRVPVVLSLYVSLIYVCFAFPVWDIVLWCIL